MPILKCEICGGDLELSVNSEYSVCENCGNTAKADSVELERIRRIYKNAEQKTRLNSIDGYKSATDQLETIPFVTEAQDKIAFCEKRLIELKATEAKRNADKEQTEKNDSKIGIIILVLFLLMIALVVAGGIYVIYHIKCGDLLPTATEVIITAVAVTVIALIISKIKS